MEADVRSCSTISRPITAPPAISLTRHHRGAQLPSTLSLLKGYTRYIFKSEPFKNFLRLYPHRKAVWMRPLHMSILLLMYIVNGNGGCYTPPSTPPVQHLFSGDTYLYPWMDSQIDSDEVRSVTWVSDMPVDRAKTR